jgi:large subunit ribosomal protein L22
LKYSKGIGKFIRGKKIEDAIHDLNLVRLKKKAVPMMGEMAHKKGKGMATGKYPVKASENFLILLKSLSANGANHGMDVDNMRIAMTVPNKAPEQVHRGGRTMFKRTHVKIIAKEGKK